jgi:hypothetical protein
MVIKKPKKRRKIKYFFSCGIDGHHHKTYEIAMKCIEKNEKKRKNKKQKLQIADYKKIYKSIGEGASISKIKPNYEYSAETLINNTAVAIRMELRRRGLMTFADYYQVMNKKGYGRTSFIRDMYKKYGAKLFNNCLKSSG